MAKLFNIYLQSETKNNESDYLGSYKAKTLNEAVRAALDENDLDPRLYNKKDQTYDGRKVWEQ